MAKNLVNNAPSIQFLGGAGTVTGSKYLLRLDSAQILLDCGLFQGLKALRLRNWAKTTFDPSKLDAVILSHAHIDHCGYLPRLVNEGFAGPVYCTQGTGSLLKIMLPDSAHIQEEEAAYANKKGYSKHHPALPLYTASDAERALGLVKPLKYGEELALKGGVTAILRRAGHILGSATVEIGYGELRRKRFVFSGDLGRSVKPMLLGPDPVHLADVLLVESTYGDRLHPTGEASSELAQVVSEAVERGGALLIPSFAVGRAQELIWRLRELEESGRIPRVPIFIDSPMARNVSDVFCQHPEDHAIDMKLLMDEERCPLCCKPYQFLRTPEESKTLNDVKGPLIIIAASGMATAGRIVHHLERRLSDSRTTVLLVGFQAAGTRGRSLQDGAKHLKMYGHEVKVRAHVATLDGLSAHADQHEILQWLRNFRRAPEKTYIVHGEPGPAGTLAGVLKKDLGWDASVAIDGATVSLPS